MPDLDYRLMVIDQLHTLIDKVIRQANIKNCLRAVRFTTAVNRSLGARPIQCAGPAESIARKVSRR
jgi:hypothetical protein